MQVTKTELSRREKAIAALVAEGLTNREIAERLFISERTVDSHLEHVREKLEVKSRAQVAAWFVAQTKGDGTATVDHRAHRPAASTRRRTIAAALIVILVVAVLVGLWRLSTGSQPSHATSNPLARALKPVWATKGGEHPFSWPGMVGLDDQGAVYVLDRGNYRVQKLSSSGSYVTSWGGQGSDPGQFITDCATGDCPPACTGGFDPVQNGPCAGLPGSLAVDRAGRVWVFDYTGRVQAFDVRGRLQSVWGKKGTGGGELAGPGFLAFDSEGNVIVSDSLRIQRFTADGRYLGSIGSAGAAAGQYLHPGPIAVDSHDNVYAVDLGCRPPCVGGRVLKFDNLGRSTPWSPSVVINGPQALAIDAHDNLWVLENPAEFVVAGQKLWEFDSAGHVLRAWSTSAFHYPFGLAIDNRGDAFITDLPDGAEPNDGRLSKVALE